MSMRTRTCRAVALGLMFTAVCIAAAKAALATPAASVCHQEWSDATAVIEREGLASAKGVGALTRKHAGGELVRITLCLQDGSFVYRLVVRDAQGRLQTLTVDARRPFAETAARAPDVAEAPRVR